MKIIIRIFCLFVLIWGLNISSNNVTYTEADFNTIIANNNYVVVDVRTKNEYKENHLDNTINIPYDEISSRINISKKDIILIYCDDYRSEKAYEYFIRLGYQAYQLKEFTNYNL